MENSTGNLREPPYTNELIEVLIDLLYEKNQNASLPATSSHGPGKLASFQKHCEELLALCSNDVDSSAISSGLNYENRFNLNASQKSTVGNKSEETGTETRKDPRVGLLPSDPCGSDAILTAAGSGLNCTSGLIQWSPQSNVSEQSNAQSISEQPGTSIAANEGDISMSRAELNSDYNSRLFQHSDDLSASEQPNAEKLSDDSLTSDPNVVSRLHICAMCQRIY